MYNIISLVETTLGSRHTTSRKYGYEKIGPCPWCGGSDRFHVWPNGGEDIPGIGNLGRFQCMDSRQGRAGCGRSGDIISYLELRRGLSFIDACRELGIDPQVIIDYRREQKGLPAQGTGQRSWSRREKSLAERSEKWRTNARELARYASSQLEGAALDYLRRRSLTDQTIKTALLGFYPRYKRVNASLWGYEYKQDEKHFEINIPRGILIPWFDEDNQILCLRFRRLPEDESEDARRVYGVDKQTGKINRYKALSGSASHLLYRGDLLLPGNNVALFEGEFTALVAQQSTLDQSVICVATGPTSWGRTDRNLRKLAGCSQILVCFDNDRNGAGERAATNWTSQLEHAHPWKPFWGDVNDMVLDGVDVGGWLSIGFEESRSEQERREEATVDYSDGCADCHTSIETDDGRQFFYIPISEMQGICYCSLCRDEQGNQRKNGQPENEQPQLSATDREYQAHNHPVVSALASLFNASIHMLDIPSSAYIAEQKRTMQHRATVSAEEASQLEKEAMIRLAGYGLYLTDSPCQCGCRLKWSPCGYSVCARCEPGGLWSVKALSLLRMLGKREKRKR